MPTTTSPKTQQQLVAEIDAYIRNGGSSYSAWYCGVASDPRDRLFNDHNVQEHGGQWIYRDCDSDTAARQVEQYFLNCGCKGGPGGGDWTSRFVYSYGITSTTRE